MTESLGELLERFRRGAELIAVTMTGAAGPELDFSPQPGKWCIRQIVCHLADSEIVGAERFRRIIAEDTPTILAFDQDAWAEKLDYKRRRISQAIETFRRIRGENYELLRALPEEVFKRTGVHSERGPLSLAEMVRLYAEHAEKHAVQIRDLRAAYKESRRNSS